MINSKALNSQSRSLSRKLVIILVSFISFMYGLHLNNGIAFQLKKQKSLEFKLWIVWLSRQSFK